MVDGTIRIKSTRTELNQITCKSILLARTESKYIGGELSVMENIESYEYLVYSQLMNDPNSFLGRGCPQCLCSSTCSKSCRKMSKGSFYKSCS